MEKGLKYVQFHKDRQHLFSVHEWSRFQAPWSAVVKLLKPHLEQSHFDILGGTQAIFPVKKLLEDYVGVVPFGIKQISDSLVVDLHVGHLNSEAFFFPLFLLCSFKQSTAKSRNETWLVPWTHHSVRLSWTWYEHKCRHQWKEVTCKYGIWSDFKLVFGVM